MVELVLRNNKKILKLRTFVFQRATMEFLFFELIEEDNYEI